MTSRREKTAQRNASRKSRTIIIASIVAVVIVLLGAVLLSSGKRSITAIEQVIPQEAGIVFISDPNQSSWDYMNALAGLPKTTVPEDVDNIGFASIETSPTVYLSVNEDRTENIEGFLKENTIPYQKKGLVYALTAEESRLSDSGLATNSDYRKGASKGSSSSFGYINFPEVTKDEGYKNLNTMFPSAGKWYGKFNGGKWSGEISDVNYSQVNKEQNDKKVLEDPAIRLLADGIESKTGTDTVKGSFTVNEITSATDTNYQTSIREIEFEINGGQLTFTLK